VTENAAIDDHVFFPLVMDGSRLRILSACSEGPRTVAELGLPARAARRHLKRLVEAGLIVEDGKSYAAVSDWRPIIAAFQALEKKSRPGRGAGSGDA
jgi:predicted transcriptional regulator